MSFYVKTGEREFCAMELLGMQPSSTGAYTLGEVLALAKPITLSFDTETVGCNPKTQSPWDGQGRVKVFSIAWQSEGTTLVNGRLTHNVTSLVGTYEDMQELFDYIGAKVSVVGHNLYGYDYPILSNHAVDWYGRNTWDTLALARLLFAGSDKPLGLKALAKEYCGIHMTDFHEAFLAPTVRKDGSTGRLSPVPLEEITPTHPLMPRLIEYAHLDAVASLRLFEALAPIAEQTKARGTSVMGLYESSWRKLYEILGCMSRRGAGINPDACRASMVNVDKAQEDFVVQLKDWFHANGNLAVNVRSPQQMQHFLYGKEPAYIGKGKAVYIRGLGMQVSPVCAKGPTKKDKQPTDAAAIAWLAEKYPEHTTGLSSLLSIRTCESSRKYLNKLRYLSEAQGGRIHPSAAPSTSTGRLAVSKPEMQQLPKLGTKDPYGVRSVVVPEPGHVLIALDYSQLEMRILGHLINKVFGDRSFIDDLLTEDPHSANALKVFGQLDPKRFAGVKATDVKSHPDPVVRGSRDAIKAVAYGIVYGKTEHGLGGSIKDPNGMPIGTEAAKRIIDGFFRLYPSLPAYTKWITEYAQKNGYTPTLLGRRRYFPDINAKNKGIRRASERAALNAPIQGSAADIVTLAMIELDKAEAMMVLQVHDEIVFECKEHDSPRERAEQYKQIMRDCLAANGIEFTCPLEVTGGIGRNWGECK